MFLKVCIVFLIVIFISQNVYADNFLVENLSAASSQITSKSMRVEKAEGNKEKKVIFVGDVHYENRNKTISFSGDKMIIGFKKNTQFKYFQILGSAMMETGKVQVSSQEAYSNNLKAHIDFFGNVTLSINGSPIKVGQIRYNFSSGTFSLPE